jgi:hypothetical protein
MGAWWSPGRSPSKHATDFNKHGFDRQRFAAVRNARKLKASGANASRTSASRTKVAEHKAHLQERLQRSSSPNIASAVLTARKGTAAYPAVLA